MVKSYRAIQQWNHWLSHFLGSELLSAEKAILLSLVKECYGKHAVLIGVPKQYNLLEETQINNHYLITPMSPHHHLDKCIEGDWNELPISSGSAELVILPHTLEYVGNPRQVLSEACRIVKPEGCLIIFGFNPYSLWGLKNSLERMWNRDTFINEGNFIPANSVKKWLSIAEFDLIKQKTLLFRPPVTHSKVFRALNFFEWVGRKSFLPWGGVYMLMAKAKVVPLTPIRLYWKQQLPSIKLSMSGPSIRNIK